MSEYFNLNEGLKKAEKRFFRVNLKFNKKYLPLILISLAIPLTVVLALVSQEIRSRAGGGSLLQFAAINPGIIEAREPYGGNKPRPVGLSALGYDSQMTPINSGVSYEWSISSQDGVGTLTNTNGVVTEFIPLKSGCGVVTVIARYDNYSVTKSADIVVWDGINRPVCAPPTPTPSLQPAAIQFNSIKLHGIGSGGDNKNPTTPGNLNPQRKDRILTIEVTDGAGNTYAPESGNISYDTNSRDFSGNITLNPDTTYDGDFIIKIKSPQYLKKQIPGIITFRNNGTIEISSISLTTGDIDNNNVINIKDYDVLLDCYSDLLPARNCNDLNKKNAADISDDGKVNSSDYNLFLRELSIVSGD